MTLYRQNLRLSQEMFTIISCFEIALRNAIDRELRPRFGNDWLRDSVNKGGIFDRQGTRETFETIRKEYHSLIKNRNYSHENLLSKLSFGVWKYMFGRPQYTATGKCLISIFPNKPKSTPNHQINHTSIYTELDNINSIRNRIAHHEPICFDKGKSHIDTSHVRNKYSQLIKLYNWMGIDSSALLYGLDHVLKTCDQIDRIQW